MLWACVHKETVTAYKKGNFDPALADFNKAIELDPKYALAYNGRGNVYDEKGNRDQAIADFTKAIELNPKYYEAYGSRSLAYSLQKNYDKAIADDLKQIELDPKQGAGYKRLLLDLPFSGNAWIFALCCCLIALGGLGVAGIIAFVWQRRRSSSTKRAPVN